MGTTKKKNVFKFLHFKAHIGLSKSHNSFFRVAVESVTVPLPFKKVSSAKFSSVCG